MGNLFKPILAEKENVEIALGNLKEAVARPEKSVIELSAMATFLHNIYNGMENILKQVLKIKEITVPKSESWHKDLLSFSKSYKIISEELYDKLFEYMTFRHFFVHAYGFMLEKGQLENLTDSIPEIWSQFTSEIEEFLNEQVSKSMKGNRK